MHLSFLICKRGQDSSSPQCRAEVVGALLLNLEAFDKQWQVKQSFDQALNLGGGPTSSGRVPPLRTWGNTQAGEAGRPSSATFPRAQKRLPSPGRPGDPCAPDRAECPLSLSPSVDVPDSRDRGCVSPLRLGAPRRLGPCFSLRWGSPETEPPPVVLFPMILSPGSGKPKARNTIPPLPSATPLPRP